MEVDPSEDVLQPADEEAMPTLPDDVYLWIAGPSAPPLRLACKKTCESPLARKRVLGFSRS